MKQYFALVSMLLFSIPSVANDVEKINLVKKIHEPIILRLRDFRGQDKWVDRYAEYDLKRWIRLGSTKGSNCLEDGVCYCYDYFDVRHDTQDPSWLTFNYGISPKGYVNVEGISIAGNGEYSYQRNRQYKLSGSPGNYKVSDVFIQEKNGNWSSWKQGFKDCYAGRAK